MKKLSQIFLGIIMLITLSSFTINDDIKQPLKDGYKFLHCSGVMAFRFEDKIGFCIPSTDLHIYGFYEFSDIYLYDWSDRGCLIWVAQDSGNGEKWAIFNGFRGKLETEFLYDFGGVTSLPTKIKYDKKANIATYEINALKNGENVKFEIEVKE